jgi:hypothetical protein
MSSRRISLLVAVAVVLAWSPLLLSTESGLPRTRNVIPVVILGTYHMHNPEGGSMFRLDVDDVKVPARQKQIKELVESLVQFQPTKVLIENAYGSNRFTKRYTTFLEDKNEANLSTNEIEQVGFRVAANMNHETLYPFDFKKNLSSEAVMALVQEVETFSKDFDALLKEAQAFFEETNEKLKTSTVMEFLKFANSGKGIDFHHTFYMEFLKYGKGDNYAGVDMTLEWYERNLKMFHNVTRITNFENERERLLIIVGSAHVKLLKDFVEDAPYFSFVDVRDYL